MSSPEDEGKSDPLEVKLQEFRAHAEKVKQDFASRMAEGRAKLADAEYTQGVSSETIEGISAKFDEAEREFYAGMARSQQEFEKDLAAARDAARRT